MFDETFELPLCFAGHEARIVVTRLEQDHWYARTEVDGRVLGHEYFIHRAQVDRFCRKMQTWLTQMEATERQLVA